MGKSKFPGKPSKLINKKRISVLQNTKCIKVTENNGKNIQGNNTNQPITNCTTDRNKKDDDGDNDSLVQKFPDKLPSSEPPDGGGGGGCSSSSSRKQHKNHNNISSIQTRARNIEPHNNNNNLIKNKLENNKNKDKQQQQHNLLLSSTSSIIEKEKPLVKKKTVTFKNILETSDDACAIKKVYNPVINAPLIPIIKRECLSRSVRLARSDCIVRPSRLTDILKNNSNNNNNNIDKLNYLKSSLTTTTNSLSLSSMDDTNNEFNNSFSKGSIYIDGKKYCSDNNKGDNIITSTTTTRYDNNNIVIAGDKRFVLPKRSVHSCRVIKPNKRFLDDDNIEILNKNHNIKNININESNSSSSDNERNKINKKLSPHGGSSGSGGNNSYENFIENINQEQKQNVNFTNNNNNTNIVKFNNTKLNDITDNFVTEKSSISSTDDTNTDPTINDDKIIEEKKKNFFNSTLFTTSNQNLFSTMSTSKVILRQPRLQYDSPQNCFKECSNSLSNHSPFTLNLGGNINTYSQSLGNADICGVCGTIINPRNLLDSRKYGIYCCEICRKFISKTTKRSVASTGVANSSLQCSKGDGSCTISPLIKSSLKNFKRTYKERCAACWLKKCILICHLPSGHKNRLSSILSISNNSDDLTSAVVVEKYSTTRTFGDICDGKVLNNDKTNDMLTSSSSNNNGLFLHNTNANKKSLSWNLTENIFDNNNKPVLSNLNCNNDIERNSISSKSSLGSLSSNSLNNNITFGGLPTINPQLLEKTVFMSNTAVKSIEEDSTTNVANKNNQQNAQCSKTNTVPTDINPEIVENNNKLKLRKKDNNKSADGGNTTNNFINQNQNVSTGGNNDGPKRQRIDLKGPRVKHVCRSASIVLGQTIATFPDDTSPILDTMDTPPRPESPNNAEVELADSIVSENCSSCSHQNNTDLGLSPPATPTFEKNSDDCEQILSKDDVEEEEENSNENVLLSEKETTGIEKYNKNKFDDINKPPTTRKIARPILSYPTSLLATTNTTRNLNASSKKLLNNKNDEIKMNPTTISIDFWENYDPAEVSQSGFGLIVTETLPIRALCFLCGSIGIDPMIFCACCCEPYHQYCVADEYNFKHSSLDDTMNSLLDRSVNPIENINLITNRLNWLCPRCTVCYTCNMSSGSKVKCQKCQKSYHTTCLGTSKRLLGADRPLICASCLKCKSCGTTKVSKFIGNLPMCLQCFKLRKKGNFCPICQKCYEDNDFDLKMMECGGCQKWVHAKCEGLSDEQYNLLSTLPESIEFICKICSSYTNIPENGKHGSEWREAVAAEFKSGLLSVVKLLSKRKQACALLKLSPRKTFPTNCICQVSNVVRNLQFKKNSNLSLSDDESSSQDNNVDDITNSTNADDLKDPTIICQKCIYPSHRGKISGGDNMSLVDIKQKINAGDYVSLAEFNYDMNNVISSSNCDELIIAYKEILSEAFPWFQNETKACTDALEEDMFDSCNFSQNSADIIIGNGDQQVPDINLPEDIDDCLYSPNFNDDMRICLFCKGRGEGDSMEESRLLYCGHNLWVHINCAMWSAEVFEEIDGSLQNVHSAIARGRMIKCTLCGNRGATVGCNVKSCGAHYHYPCARKTQCAFMTDKTVYCPEHLTFDNNKKWTFERNFEVLRPVYVELDRKKKKMVEPAKIKFIIGSLEVKKLGKVFAKFSDTSEAIVPIDFICTRLYWSIKEPWKIVQYTIKTSIQNNILSLTNDSGCNFTVDHSNNLSVVQMELTQISQWHNSLIPLEETEILLRSNERASIKQILEAVGQQLCPDETTTEEEPQNNADLLPPELKDAIFEDLPHEILDGISMLDIFPKLMIYEDMLAIDSKSEGFFTSEYSKDNTGENMSDEEINNENCNKDLIDSAWSMASGITHVEDALLSAVRPVTANSNREIKRTKTDGLNRTICGPRSQQRSSSLTWSCKLDNHSMKRRKLSKGFQDIRLPDGVVLSLGRRKEDFPVRRASQNDELKTKTFTWSAAKKYCQEAFLPTKELTSSDKMKISQLDGMDDFTSEESGDFHMTIQQRVYDPNSTEHPVKCDRCHCTYRTHESYQRHLQQCEPLSTSESESETAPRSPDAESPVQSILIDMNKARQLQTSTSFIQNFNQSFPLSTNATNLIGRQNGNVQLTPIQGTSSIQIQNNGMPITQLNQGMSNIFINAGQQQVLNQQGLPLHQQFIPTIQNINQAMNQFTSTAPMSTVQIGMDSNGQQIFTIAPQQQQTMLTTGNFSNIEQQKTQRKQKNNVRNSQSPNKNKTKNLNNMTKNKKINSQILQQNQINQNQIPIQIFRSQNDLQQKPIVLQQATNSQPIILQQVGNSGQQPNIVSYVDSNNSVQYVAVPSTNEFKQPQTPQFLTAPNQLVQGTFLQTDSSGNLVLTNGPSGLQMLSTGSLQLGQPTQPQVIGTLIQPQPTAIQCGVLSDQMVLGASPMDMMTNPAMLLTAAANQPMYYGLETIVQNTVMSSQQFVSTAMQGVLSQNSSFSATTTQVFQASKIEPIMEVPAGYVVLNNVDGMIQQPNTNQGNIISANILQQPQTVQPIYNVQSQQQQQQQQPTIIQTQQTQPIQAHIIQTSHQQPQQQQQRTQQIPINTIHSQIRAVSPVKPTVKSTPIIVKKIQPHTINHKIITNPTITSNTQQNKNMKTSKAQIIATSISDSYNNPIIITTTTDNNDFLNSIKTTSLTNGGAATIISQPLKPKITNSTFISNVPTVTNITPIKTVQKKMNMIKPVNKVSSVTIKPKIINNKSVSSKNTQNCKTSSVPQLIAPKPNPLITDNKITELKNQIDDTILKLNDHSKQQNIRVVNTMNNDKNIFENNSITLQSMNNSIINNIQTPQTIVVKSISIDSQDNLTPTSISVTSAGHCLDNISNNPVFTQNNININYTPETVGILPPTTITPTEFTQGQQIQTSVNLPISSSIQLPLAPFISPYGSNIPTNIVNPIQQIVQSTTIPTTTTHIQNNQIISRPTNRVLPMQTVQPKNIPSTTVLPTPSPTETKCKTKNKILIEEQQQNNEIKNSILTNISSSIHENSNTNYDMVIDKANFEEDIGSNIDSNNTVEDTNIFMCTDDTNNNADCDEMIKFVDKCKEKSVEILENNCIENNTDETNTNDFDFMSAIEIGNNDDDNKNLKDNIQDDICSESTTLEVKEKICEILENLENDDCNKKTNLLHNDNYNENNNEINDDDDDDIEMKEHNSKSNYCDQKENINPLSTNNLLLEQQPSSYKIATLKPNIQNNQQQQQQKAKGPRILYEIQSEDGFTYKSTSITEIWEKVFEAVQVARKAHGLAPLPDGPLADMCGVQMLGLKTNALRYLIEQLPGVERCTQYTPKYHKKDVITTDYSSDQEEYKENIYGTARNEPFVKRSDYDMFSWLASRHRKQPIQVVVQQSDNELIQRRGTGSNLPMAMKYRTLKETYKDYVGVFRSHIHGRGLYCTKDIEAGEMVIEYAGELIRSTLTDKRERYYDSKGIGCYMFKIDDNLVVDATMRGNAARFINHSCEPNCYSKVVDILGHKHIIIFALRRIVQGEELTYDYKFPFEDVKIPCSCGSKRCRKYLN